MTKSDKTIISVLTPPGRGAISTVVVRGSGAVAMVQSRFCRKQKRSSSELPVDRILFGVWAGADVREDEVPTGEEVVVCRRTDIGDDQQVEIHCHGGKAARQAILADLAAVGGDVVPWSDWVCKTAASRTMGEAQLALAHTTTLRTAQILLDQAQGALQRRIAEIARDVAKRPDEALARLESLLQTAQYGVHLTSPFRVVVVGPVNVGKSSLTNALVGYSRAIVHDAPGTTRDILTAVTAIDGWPIECADTAGIRATHDPVEAAGIGMAESTAQSADCIVMVFDVAQPWNDDCDAFCHRFSGDRTIIVQNKVDLLPSTGTDRPCDLATSATKGDGVQLLLERISRILVPDPPDPGDAVVFTRRQQDLVQRAVRALGKRCLDDAQALLAMMDSLAER
jgi:tRNA modification GTPase